MEKKEKGGGRKGEKMVGKEEKQMTDFVSEETAFSSWNILLAFHV